jgi:hypothetical protein
LRFSKDADESVRDAAAWKALEVIGDFEAAGNPKKADELLDQMARFSASKGAPRDFDRDLAETKTRLDHERAFLYKGETVTTNKGSRIDRYLRVDRRLIDVTPEEYDAAMARFGKPYVTEKQFQELRDEDNERLQRINDEKGRREKPVKDVPGSQTASPSGKAPEARSDPVGEYREKTSSKSPSSYRTVGSFAILAVLGWLIFRITRRKP